MSKELELLSRPINFAVVQLPEREYPGVVIQGDSLKALVQSVERMAKLLGGIQASELALEIEMAREQLQGALTHYEIVCSERGISLPYCK